MNDAVKTRAMIAFISFNIVFMIYQFGWNMGPSTFGGIIWGGFLASIFAGIAYFASGYLM